MSVVAAVMGMVVMLGYGAVFANEPDKTLKLSGCLGATGIYPTISFGGVGWETQFINFTIGGSTFPTRVMALKGAGSLIGFWWAPVCDERFIRKE